MVKPAARPARPPRRGMQPIAPKWLTGIGRMLLIALLARSRLVGEWCPFAPACVSAALMHGWGELWMLAGCGIGAFFTGFAPMEQLVFCSCGIVCGLRWAERAVYRLFPHLPHSEDGACALRAALGQLIPAWAVSGGLMYNLMTAALSAIVAGILAPALVSGMGVRLSRRRLMPDEQLSLGLLMLMILIALSALPRVGGLLAQTAAVWMTLVGSFSDCGRGALVGICAGSALSLGGSSPFIGASLCLCGVLAGCMKDLNRPMACVAFGAGSLLTVTWGLGYTIGMTDPLPLLMGCALYCLMPHAGLVHLRGWLAPSLPRLDSEQLAVRVRRKAGRRLSEVSGIFGELADGYGEQRVLPDEKQLVCRMRSALCTECEQYAACWKGESHMAERMLCQWAQQVLSASAEGASPVRPDEKMHCRRASRMEQSILPLLQEIAEERRAQLKRGEARSLMAHQFREAQNILNGLSTRMGSGVCLNEEFARLTQAALDYAGMPCREVVAVMDDRLEIICVLREGTWSAQRAQEAARLLSAESGLPFSPVLSHGRVIGECELYLIQSPALTARFSALSRPLEAGMPCGDSHMIQLLPDGQLIAAISDGMGNGEQAAQESGRCVSLLRKFVSAGIDRDAALNAVNQLLMMRGSDEMFATADLCVVNLYSGIASFSKLGAGCSFVLQEKGIRQIAGGRLPLGILDSIQPASSRMEVYPGDVLVMISDGIADEMKEGQCQALKAFLPSVRHLSTERIVHRVMDWARERDGGIAKDDMTVIAVRILARSVKPRSSRPHECGQL